MFVDFLLSELKENKVVIYTAKSIWTSEDYF